MDTIETRDEPAPATRTVYDGFISYSHAADDLLAPRLQAGLQRFAKPWWQRRALRMFRDEASLSANPHLWSSITEALDQSDWFVLLLSPDAAESAWVNREVEYWLEHKDRDRIIPVVTDGDFAWAGGDIDPATTSAPPALYGTFTDEPRWVDLKFARSEEQLDLNNASFRAAIADIASAIRGVPKDELESEEVRQHRRTVRTAWAAAVALVLLVVFASAAAVFANGQRLEADAQRQVAEDQTVLAEAETVRAEGLEFEARSDALAASAIAQLDTDPELALLLATQSLAREDQESAVSATHRALQRHHTIYQLQGTPGNTPNPDGAVGGLSPVGDLLVMTTQGQSFAVWDIASDQELWTTEFESPDTTIRSVRFTEDGSEVVALVSWSTDIDPFAASFPDDVPFGLYVYDTQSGDFIRSIDLPACPSKLVPSPLAAYVDLSAPLPWVTVADLALSADEERDRGTCDTFNVAAGFLHPADGAFTPVGESITGNRNQFGVPTTDAFGRLLATGASGPGEVIHIGTAEVAFDAYEGGISTLSADGTLLLAGGNAAGFPLELWDVAIPQQLWTFPAIFTRAWFSSDERTVYGTSPDGSAYVLDATTGEQILRLRGHDGAPIAATMSEDGRRLATFGDDFAARVWDLSPIRSERRTYVAHESPRVHLAASADLASGFAALWGGDRRQEPELWETRVFHLDTGEILARVDGGVPALSPDGTRLAYRSVEEVDVASGDFLVEGEPGLRPRVGPVRIIDVATGDFIEIDVPCVEYLMPDRSVPSTTCRDPHEAGGVEWDLEFSPDGTLLAMADSHDDEMIVLDATTGAEVGSARQPGANVRAVAFTPDGSQVVFLLSGTNDWVLRVYDTHPFALVTEEPVTEGSAFAEMVFSPDGSLLAGAASDGTIAFVDAATWDDRAPLRAHQGAVLDVAFSPSGDLIASVGNDAFLRVWSGRSLVTEVQFDVDEMANVEFINDTHLLVTSGFGSAAIEITLDATELLTIARSRLTRSFTVEECTTFEVDPCPTLADLKQATGS